VFNKEKIAMRAIQRADEKEQHIKCMWRRTIAIIKVGVSGVCVFLIVFSTGILSREDNQPYMYIDDPRVPLAASHPDLLAEDAPTHCPVCGHEIYEGNYEDSDIPQ